MYEALAEAEKAYMMDEVPIGAVIVKDGIIIGRGHNEREKRKEAIAHAEILAIKDANKRLNGWRLTGCDMYVTVEPCAMCAGAIVLSRIKRLYIGTLDGKAGACGSLMNIVQDERLNHRVEVFYGILGRECSEIIKKFFKNKRK